MGIFQNLFPMSPLGLIGSGVFSKKDKAVQETLPTGEVVKEVPFGNLKKVTGGSNVAYTEGAKDYSTQNYYSNPTGDAQVVIQTKKEANTSPDVTQASERGFGSTGTMATGENASATSEENSNPILTYALIGAGLLAGVYILKK
jgi:hypothetical protein